MTTRSASSRTRAATSRRRPARAVRRRRSGAARVLAVLCTAALAAVAAVAIIPSLHDAVQKITLPLKHEDIIRQQASEKGIDPSLIAAVIYAESHFRDGQESSAGAKGLMQLTPATARYIARKSGGTAFEVKDLATPQVNIAYGSYYLRYLLRQYQNVPLALAAYNAGEGNVNHWIAEHGGTSGFGVDDIPFAETRAYVTRVLDAQQEYRDKYARELGL